MLSHRVTYVQQSDYGEFHSLTHYPFLREMIISHWLRNIHDVALLGTDVTALLIRYSADIVSEADPKSRVFMRGHSQVWSRMHSRVWNRGAQGKYLSAIRQTMQALLCLSSAPQTAFHNGAVDYPAVETRHNREYLLNPLIIARNEHVKCLLEASMNSLRISFRMGIHDAMEDVLFERAFRFLHLRAEDFGILRRKAVNGYHLSFLITHTHLSTQFRKVMLVDGILQTVLEMDKLISELKLWMHIRSSDLARSWKRSFHVA